MQDRSESTPAYAAEGCWVNSNTFLAGRYLGAMSPASTKPYNLTLPPDFALRDP